MQNKKNRNLFLVYIFIFLTVGFSLFLLALNHFLIFHTMTELFSITITYMVFIITWNTFDHLENNVLKLMGISSLSVGTIDLLHTLAYKGMNLFPNYDVDLPTQLWILARTIQIVSLFLSILYQRPIQSRIKIILVYFVISSVFIGLIFLRLFPSCYVEGEGLTQFKKVMEVILVGVVLLSIFLFYFHRTKFDKIIYLFFQISNISLILSELAFTFYIDVYDISNILGHLFKISTFLIYYKIILQKGLQEPQNLLYFELKKKKEELEKAISEIDILQQLLPICSNCKKVRNDKGYWEQVDDYLYSHSDIKFSHGICPECAKKLYPSLNLDLERK